MAVFKPINNDLSGFDRKSKQWQMIPVGGERKIVLEDGANFKVSLKDQETKAPLPTSLMSFQEHSSPSAYKREFTIKGHKESKGLIYAEKSNSSELLFLRALPAKKCKLDFYLIKDKHNRQTGQNLSKIPEWVKNADKFIQPQTNVSLEMKKSEYLTVNKDFGSIIDAEELITYLKQKSTWIGTHPSIILVWRFNVNRQGYSDAIGLTVPPFIIIEDKMDRPEDRFRDKLLAHEIAHYFIGPAHHENNENLLFHKLNSAAYLDRQHLLKFNKLKPAYWS